MQLSKRLRAEFLLVKCQKAKVGAKSHEAVETAPLRKVSGIYTLPTEIIGGVVFNASTFTNADLFSFVSRGRQMAREQAAAPVPTASSVFGPTMRVDARSKYAKTHPAGPGRTGSANSVPSFDSKAVVVRVIPVVSVAKVSNAAKKEVVKRVKKNVPPVSYVGSSWGAVHVVEEVRNARMVLAGMPKSESEILSGRIRYAQAVLAIWGNFCQAVAV